MVKNLKIRACYIMLEYRINNSHYKTSYDYNDNKNYHQKLYINMNVIDGTIKILKFLKGMGMFYW